MLLCCAGWCCGGWCSDCGRAPELGFRLKHNHVHSLGFLNHTSMSCLLCAADGVVLLYDPRHVRQPLHTLPLESRAPVTSLHWQHRYVALPGSRRSAAAAAAAPAAAGAQAASKGPGLSRLGMPPSGSTAPAAPAATPAASVAASIGAAAASIGSCIPAAPAAAPTPAGGGPTPAAAATAEPAGDAAASYASRPAGAASQPGSSAAAVRAKLAADSLQLHPLSAARHRPAGASILPHCTRQGVHAMSSLHCADGVLAWFVCR